MSVISIETAALSRSRLAKGFNGDSINLNRRVSSVEEMNNGYRAAGKIAPPCVCTVASAPVKGVAAGAVTAFDDYSHTIYKLRADAQGEMKRYMDDMSAVAAECGVKELSLASVCVFSDKILASSVGSVKVFVCSHAGVSEISSDNGEFKFSDLSDLQDGGFIVVLGAECAAYADAELIGIVTSQSDNIKAVSKALFTSLNKVAGNADITAVFFKITAEDKAVKPESAVAAAAVETVIEKKAEDKPEVKKEAAAEEKTAENKNDEEKANDESIENAENEESASSEDSSFDEDDVFAEFDDEEEEESDKKQLSAGKKLLGLIPFIVLAALVGIVLAVYVFTGPKKDDLMKTTTPSSDIDANADINEPVTEHDTKNNEETTTETETTTAASGQTTTTQANAQTTTTRANNNQPQPPTVPPTTPPTAPPTQPPTTPSTAPPTTEATTTPPTTNPPTTQPTTRITDQGNHKPFG